MVITGGIGISTASARAAAVRSLCVLGIATVLVAGCGKEEEAAVPVATNHPGQATARGPSATTPANSDATAAAKDAQMATAVTDGKPGAAVDLRYDVPSKPEVNQPFAVELEFDPRLPADTLDIEIGDSPGLSIDGEHAARFAPVEASQKYSMKLQVSGNVPGIYYVSVIAKMATKVQTDSRAFAIPVVIGTMPAAEKPEPQKDASGHPIQSMPAKEG